MIISEVYASLDAIAKHNINAIIASPFYLHLVQKHIAYLNEHMAFLNADDENFRVQYKSMRIQRDLWLALQERIVKLLNDQPHLATENQSQQTTGE